MVFESWCQLSVELEIKIEKGGYEHCCRRFGFGLAWAGCVIECHRLCAVVVVVVVVVGRCTGYSIAEGKMTVKYSKVHLMIAFVSLMDTRKKRRIRRIILLNIDGAAL